jgi:hypothetical protein
VAVVGLIGLASTVAFVLRYGSGQDEGDLGDVVEKFTAPPGCAG